jgi:CDP-paratose 2-epimerase
MRILITGICGFVGSQLALGLLARLPGISIVGIDSLIRRGSELHRQTLIDAGIKIIHGDIRCASDLESLGPADWVIDAAANPSVLAGVDGRTSSRQLVEHNLAGTVNLLEYCKLHRAGLVILSTSRVYSVNALLSVPLTLRDNAFVPDTTKPMPAGCSSQGITEDFSTTAPITLYGATKLSSEVLALEYGQVFNLPIIVNRCGVMAGAGQLGTAEQGIFSFWVRAHALKRPLKYIGFTGQGQQVRDAFHPDDLAELLIKQFARPSEASGVWNVAGGAENAMSLAQLTRWCDEHSGKHPVASEPAPRPMDVPWLVMDSARVRQRFDWTPKLSLTHILEQILAHHRQRPDWLDRCRPL